MAMFWQGFGECHVPSFRGMVKKNITFGAENEDFFPNCFFVMFKEGYVANPDCIASLFWIASLLFHSVVFRHRYKLHIKLQQVSLERWHQHYGSRSLFDMQRWMHTDFWLKFGVQTSKIWAKNLCHDDLCANGAPPAPEGATCCHHHPILQCLCGGRGGKARSFITTCEIGFATRLPTGLNDAEEENVMQSEGFMDTLMSVLLSPSEAHSRKQRLKGQVGRASLPFWWSLCKSAEQPPLRLGFFFDLKMKF